MVYGGNGHIYAKSTLRGVALVNALIFAVLVGIFIAALYFLFNRLFGATEELRTFVSVREAAASGARYGASLTNFPEEWGADNCIRVNLDFRITGRQELGRTDITICRIGTTFVPGEEISGASREIVGGAAQGSGIFKIVSIARFPANAPPGIIPQEARVEAVYVR